MGVELRLFLALSAMFFLPGAALLSLGSAWRQWPGLQRYILAAGLSVAFFPLLYYSTRFWIPPARLGAGALAAILLLSLAVVVWRLWLSRPAPNSGGVWGRISGLEWAAVGIFALTLGSRLWFAHAHPFPAWSDSLHHVMLTQLTMDQGRLPVSMEPYYPVPITMYHLGLYALSAPAALLANAPAEQALLWTAQFLNAAGVLGVYLALDRYSGRVGAIVGASIVGLFSVHPAFYANWGRFTQVASQAILLIAWVAVVEAVRAWGSVSSAPPSPPNLGGGSKAQPNPAIPQDWGPGGRTQAKHSSPPGLGAGGPKTAAKPSPPNLGGESQAQHSTALPQDWGPGGRIHPLWTSALAAALTAAVFLLHFRVAAFYILLLFIGMVDLLWQARRDRRRLLRTLLGMAVVGALALFLILPTLWEAFGAFTSKLAAAKGVLSSEESAKTVQNYYVFPWSSVPYLVAPRWLLALTGAAALIGLVRRSRMVIIALVWTVLLYLLGNAYLTGISVLSITNLGAILIMLYMPIGLIIGGATDGLLSWVPVARRGQIGAAVAVAVLILGVWGMRERATNVEAYRHFVTPEDLTALQWIDENVPEEATFAINTYFWLPRAPHGVDAGYWIPYMTGRQITSAAMLVYGEADKTLTDRFIAESRAAERLESDLGGLDELYEMGVHYIYIGKVGDFSGPGLQPDFLRQSERVKTIYEQDGVTILEIED